jgi:crotonobetainyl-CoA:carnitine CoA-transferase CaiB-like acyl-CoA transferase
VTLVGHPELLDEPWFATGRGRADNADLIDGYVAQWIAQRDRADVLKEFERVGGAVAPVFNAKDIVEDPHIRETKMLIEVDDPDLGSVLQHNVMWRMSESPGRIRFTGREQGADTEEILINELGYSPQEIEDFREQGVIK